MDSPTIIAVVTIICTMITTVVGLIVRSGVIALISTVGEQTKELAGLHQTITSQNAKIYRQEATETAEVDAAVMKQQKAQPDQSYQAYSPFRKPDGQG